MIDDLTRSILEQRDNIENQRNREIKSNEKIVERTPQEVHDNIVELLKEIQQLKLDYELYKDNHIYKNYEVETKDNTIKQLKEIIDEAKEYINHEWFKRGQLGIIDKTFQEWQLKDILQILNKVGDDNEQ